MRATISANDLERFRQWLVDRGAEALAATNPYEELRFSANGNVGIIYSNTKNSRLRVTGEAIPAWRAFSTGGDWKAKATSERKRNKKLPVDVRAMIDRDGRGCFYCGHEMEEFEMTREHMVSVICDGTNHLANLVLAHRVCNQRAGNLSVAEKVRLRDRMRVEEFNGAEAPQQP